MRNLRTLPVLMLFLGTITLLYIGVFIYRTEELRHLRAVQEASKGQSIIARLGKLMVLPSSTPSVAIVSNVTLLRKKSQFFESANKGDVVVIYPDKVIVYNPLTNKIVNIGTSAGNKTRAITPEVVRGTP